MANEYQSFYRRELLDMVDSVTLTAMEEIIGPEYSHAEGTIFPRISGIMLMRRLIRAELERDQDG